jgi:hypothetical protein
MDTYKDVFQKACLIQLSSSHWQGSRILEQGIMERLGENSEWLRGRKYLINPELLGPIRTALHQARGMVQKFSLPFPITSLYLVPKESLTVVDERLQAYKNRFWNKVEEFEAVYESAREEARVNLGALFNEADYPMDIRSKFKFDWRFLVLTVPTKSKILTPEIYEREKQKFETLMDETRELAMTALREEFGQIINFLVERLGNNGGKPKTLNGSMFNKLHEFIEDLATRNIFEDERLVELCEQARSVIGGVSPYGLKYNDSIRENIHSQMAVLKNAIDVAIEDIPRRKIRLAA